MYKKLALFMAVAALLGGCKSTSSSDSTAPVAPQQSGADSANPQQATDSDASDASRPGDSADASSAGSDADAGKGERKYYPWEMVTDVCPYLDEGLRYENYKNGAYGDFEPITCQDGKVYCYGVDSRPIVQPESSDGWDCRIVEKLPRSHVIPNVYYDLRLQYVFWSDTEKREVRTPVPLSFMRAWVCTESDCSCGAQQCPQNSLCIDGACYCNDAPLKGKSCKLYASKVNNDQNDDDDDNDDENYEGYKDFTTCKNKKGKVVSDCWNLDEEERMLYCNNMLITNRDVQTCIRIADKKYAMLYYYDDEKEIGFYAGNPTFANEDILAERKENQDNKAFQCGKETCVNGEICLNNKCVSIGTRAKLPSDKYTWNAFMPECVDPAGCACAKQQCAKGQFCIEGECKDSPLYQKVRGKWIRYGVVHSMIREGQSALESPNLGIWLDILTHSSGKPCDGAPVPANSEDYTCMFELRDAEGDQEYWSARGFYCAKSEGCACGKNTCPMHAQCRDGACVYDALYLDEACHWNGACPNDPDDDEIHTCAWESMLLAAQNNRVNNRFVDERGWCRCGESLVPPNLPGYSCKDCRPGDDCIKRGSMECIADAGCPCGDAKCAKGEHCITPGTCRK